MNNRIEFSDEQLDQLLVMASKLPEPDTSDVEYAFETRVMARIREKQEKARAAWSFEGVAWRLSPLFFLAAVAVVTLLPEQNLQAENGDGRSIINNINVFGSAESDASWEDTN